MVGVSYVFGAIGRGGKRKIYRCRAKSMALRKQCSLPRI